MTFEFTPHIGLLVANRIEAAVFYRDLFGMEIVSETEQETEVALGEWRLHLEQAVDLSEARPRVWLALLATDLEEAGRALRERGCEVTRLQGPTPADSGLLVIDPYGLGFFISPFGES